MMDSTREQEIKNIKIVLTENLEKNQNEMQQAFH